MALIEASKILRKYINSFVQYSEVGEETVAEEVVLGEIEEVEAVGQGHHAAAILARKHPADIFRHGPGAGLLSLGIVRPDRWPFDIHPIEYAGGGVPKRALAEIDALVNDAFDLDHRSVRPVMLTARSYGGDRGVASVAPTRRAIWTAEK